MIMEQTIKIDVPEGKKAIYVKHTKSIKFVDIDTNKSRSWEEYCCKNPLLELETKKDEESLVSLLKLTCLHDEWVEGWTPDYTDNQEKWVIEFHQNCLIVSYGFYTHRFLSFPTQACAQDFLDCFGDLIEKAKRFI